MSQTSSPDSERRGYARRALSLMEQIEAGNKSDDNNKSDSTEEVENDLKRKTPESNNNDDNEDKDDDEDEDNDEDQDDDEDKDDDKDKDDDEDEDGELIDGVGTAISRPGYPVLNAQSSASDLQVWLQYANNLLQKTPCLGNFGVIYNDVFAYNTIQEKAAEVTNGGLDWSLFTQFLQHPNSGKANRVGYFSVWPGSYIEQRNDSDWAHAFAVIVLRGENGGPDTLIFWDNDIQTRIDRFLTYRRKKRKSTTVKAQNLSIKISDVLLPRQIALVGRVQNLGSVWVGGHHNNKGSGVCVRQTIGFILRFCQGVFGVYRQDNLASSGFRELDVPGIHY